MFLKPFLVAVSNQNLNRIQGLGYQVLFHQNLVLEVPVVYMLLRVSARLKLLLYLAYKVLVREVLPPEVTYPSVCNQSANFGLFEIEFRMVKRVQMGKVVDPLKEKLLQVWNMIQDGHLVEEQWNEQVPFKVV